LKEKKKNYKWWLIIFAVIIVTISVMGFLLIRLEGGKPVVILDLPNASIGTARELMISLADKKSGLRKVWVSLLKGGKEITLLEKNYPSTGIFGSGKIHEEPVKVKIDPAGQGISDGEAVLRIVVSDYSWRRWWHGNKTYIEKTVTIDTQIPEIEVLSRVHNLTQGGSGVVIYKISEPCPGTGIYVGNKFFPGYSGYFKDKKVFMAFFALNYKQGPGTQLLIKAEDQAGNSARAGFYHHIRKKSFRKDTIKISDRFLNWKMPEFEQAFPKGTELSMVDKFLKVNRDLRKVNHKLITELGEKTDKIIYWDKRFLRLKSSAQKAGFADHRVYKYKKRVIDRQVHLGIDLASVAHSPVQASNRGKVRFVGSIGIYGKTVVIDHGFGLFSAYSHLNSYEVQKGQIVSRGDVIGTTGTTGLAGGDHLHFGMFIHNTYVNPIEWWDSSWIKNNITTKIEEIKNREGT